MLLIDRLTLRIVHVVVIVGQPRNKHRNQPNPRPHDCQPCFQNRPDGDQSEDHGAEILAASDGGYASAKSIGLSCFM